jgi:esterase/lipase superfamily enzyme
MDNLYTIYIPSGKIHDNPHIIFVFPTSNGDKMDIIHFDVLQSIYRENIIIVSLQTCDSNCFYDSSLSDLEKTTNLEEYLTHVNNIIDHILNTHQTNKKSILLGCSMGGYYANLMFMRYPNRFHCISLGGFIHLQILDKNATHQFNDDKIINYIVNQDLWNQYNPIKLASSQHRDTYIISCFATTDDAVFIEDTKIYYSYLSNYRHIKTYDDLHHNFSSWQQMASDIFKGSDPLFHDFRLIFYH